MSEENSKQNNVSVLYEDADIVVINKPSGLLVHEDGRGSEPTVVEWFLSSVPSALGIGEPGKAQDGTPLERSGVVHRLDKDTSGVLILVKHRDAFAHMKAQFHDRKVKKEYRAFVYGTMKEQWGTINRSIGRSVTNFKLRSAERGARGLIRQSVTDWELIGQSQTHAYLKLIPKTGRTHQLRVHLKSMSRPIVQDTLYATDILLKSNNLGFTRLALHAYSISFILPSGGEKTCIAPLPPDFEHAETTLATSSPLC